MLSISGVIASWALFISSSLKSTWTTQGSAPAVRSSCANGPRVAHHAEHTGRAAVSRIDQPGPDRGGLWPW